MGRGTVKPKKLSAVEKAGQQGDNKQLIALLQQEEYRKEASNLSMQLTPLSLLQVNLLIHSLKFSDAPGVNQLLA